MTPPTRPPYPTDLTDAQWARIAAMVPGPTRWGSPITVPRREIVHAILYLLANGCGWSARPHDFPREGTVRDYFHPWRRAGVWPRMHDALRDEGRRRAGKEAEPSAAIVDRRSVKATRTTGARGSAAGKNNHRAEAAHPGGHARPAAGRRRPPGERPGSGRGTTAGPAGEGGPAVAAVAGDVRRRRVRRPVGRVGAGGWQVAVRIIQRSDRARGFEVRPKRWVVERTFGWLGGYRRLSKNYEFHADTSETMIHLAMIHLMLKRLAPARPPRRVDGIPAPLLTEPCRR